MDWAAARVDDHERGHQLRGPLLQKPKGSKKKLRVKKQTKKAKAKLTAGTKVGVTLKRKRWIGRGNRANCAV